MSNYPDLKQFAEKGLKNAINGSHDITKKVLENSGERYELGLTKNGGKDLAKLVLKKKGNGRPVPVVVVNAVSDTGDNLLYRDHRIDSPAEVAQNVQDALVTILERLN